MNNKGKALSVPAKEAERILADKLKKDPSLNILIQPTIPGKLTALMGVLEANDEPLTKSYKENKKEYLQWASDTLALYLENFNEYLETVDPVEIQEDMKCDIRKFLLWETLTLLYTCLYETKKILPPSQFDKGNAKNKLEILNEKIYVGGMNQGTIDPSQRRGMTAAQAAEAGNLMSTFAVQRAQLDATLQGIQENAGIASLKRRMESTRGLLKSVVQIAGTIAFLGGSAISGGDLLEGGVTNVQQIGLTIGHSVDAFSYWIPGSGENPYLNTTVTEEMYRAAWDYNASLPEYPSSFDYGMYALPNLRTEADAYQTFRTEISLDLSTRESKKSVGKNTILSSSLMKSIDGSIENAKEEVKRAYAATRSSASPMRLYNWISGETADTSYEAAVAKVDGLNRLKQLKDSGNFVEFLYSEDTQYLNEEYHTVVTSIKATKIKEKLNSVRTLLKEKGSILDSLIEKNVNEDTMIESYSLQPYYTFMDTVDKQAIGTSISGAAKAYIDYELYKVVSPFVENFRSYVGLNYDTIQGVISSQSTQHSIITGDATSRIVYVGIDELEMSCGSANVQLTSSLICRNMKKPGMPDKLRGFVQVLERNKLAIPPQIIQTMFIPYVKDPSSYKILNRYELLRLQYKINREQNPDKWIQAIFCLISATLGVYIVERIEDIASIPTNAIAILVGPLSGLAYVAKASAVAGKTTLLLAESSQKEALLLASAKIVKAQQALTHAQQQPLALANAPRPVALANAPRPVALANAPRPVALANAPRPVALANAPRPVALANAPRPVALGNAPRPVALGNAPRPVALGNAPRAVEEPLLLANGVNLRGGRRRMRKSKTMKKRHANKKRKQTRKA